MGNLDFSQQPMFSIYALFLLLSGVILIASALLPRLAGGNRAANAIFGVVFGGYGFYLVFMMQGRTYFVFIYALIVPIGLIVTTVRSLAERKSGQRNSAQQQAYAYQQQANQAQYAAWQQSQSQAQNWQQPGAPAQNWQQGQAQAQPQQGFPAPAPFAAQAPAQPQAWQSPSVPEQSAGPAPAVRPNDAPGL